MGYFFAIGRCISCGRHFTFHPERVPSLRLEGKREPVCLECVNLINSVRKANGHEAIVLLPGAYAPGSEEEDEDWFLVEGE